MGNDGHQDTGGPHETYQWGWKLARDNNPPRGHTHIGDYVKGSYQQVHTWPVNPRKYSKKVSTSGLDMTRQY